MRNRALVGLVAVLALMAGACGQEGATPPTGAEGTFPVTVITSSGEVTIDHRPERIVSLSATATEMLFAIEAGDQVVAVDDQSNYPSEAPMTELSGYTPNVEAIASYDPDLVVIGFEPGDLRSSLEALGIPVLYLDAAEDLDGTYDQIAALGAATGRLGAARDLVSEMREEIGALIASAPVLAEPPTYYHELDDTFFTATSDTFIGGVYGLLGLRNIADEAGGASSVYPQLSAEYIIEADPDVIFLADTECCDQSAQTVAARPGWDRISAVRDRAIVELDDDVASRWGPRIPEFVERVAGAMAAAG
jgi:iron complex transport system substrate-binding protein